MFYISRKYKIKLQGLSYLTTIVCRSILYKVHRLTIYTFLNVLNYYYLLIQVLIEKYIEACHNWMKNGYF